LDHPGSVSGNTNDWNNHWGNGMFAWPTLDGPDGDWLLDEQDTAMMWGVDAPRETFNWMDEQALRMQYGMDRSDLEDHVFSNGYDEFSVMYNDPGANIYDASGQDVVFMEDSATAFFNSGQFSDKDEVWLEGEAEEFVFTQGPAIGAGIGLYDDDGTAFEAVSLAEDSLRIGFYEGQDGSDGAAGSETYGLYEVSVQDDGTTEVGGEPVGRGFDIDDAVALA